MAPSTHDLPSPATSSKPDRSGINLSMLSSLGIAVVIHAVIALAVGSYVVFEGIVPVPFFNSEGIDLSTENMIVEEMPTLIEEEALPQIQTDNVQVVQEEAGGSDAPDMSDLITVTNSTLAPTFSTSTTAGNPAIINGFGSGTGGGDGIGRGKVKLGSLFGGRGIGGSALTGYLYDFKQDRDKKKIPYDRSMYGPIIQKFTNSWDPKVLEKYYKSKEPLETTQFFIPVMDAAAAPKAFNVAAEVKPSGWMIHYQGTISPLQSGTYRFAGLADDLLVVRVDNKLVFDGSWFPNMTADWKKMRMPIGGSFGHGKNIFAGEWIQLRRGQTYPIEVLLGEMPGGQFSAMLMVEEKGVNYKQNAKGYPILPIFQVMPTEIPEYSINGGKNNGGFEVMEEGLVFGAN